MRPDSKWSLWLALLWNEKESIPQKKSWQITCLLKKGLTSRFLNSQLLNRWHSIPQSRYPNAPTKHRRRSSSKMSSYRLGRSVCDMSQHPCGQMSLIAEVHRKWGGRAEICQDKKRDDNFSSLSITSSCNTDPFHWRGNPKFLALSSIH